MKINEIIIESAPSLKTNFYKRITIGNIELIARSSGHNDLQINAYPADDNNSPPIGQAQFWKNGRTLSSEKTFVDEKYQRKGIATLMYQFAASLGFKIVPSEEKTTNGRALWTGLNNKQALKAKNIKNKFTEAFINGRWNGDPKAFTAQLVHETTPERAESIRRNGFKGNPEGIFFNLDSTGYSGGGYGGAYITCNISGPADGILDMADDPPSDLDEFADGFEIAKYAKKHGYWAWKDDLQMAVLSPAHIQILSIKQ